MPLIAMMIVAAFLVGFVGFVAIIDRWQPTGGDGEVGSAAVPVSDASGTSVSASPDIDEELAVHAIGASPLAGPGQWAVLQSDGSLRRWDALVGQPVGTALAASPSPAVAASPAGDRLALAATDGTVVLHDQDGSVVGRIGGSAIGGEPLAVGFHRQAGAVLTLSTGGLLRGWDRRTLELDGRVAPLGLDVELLAGVVDGIDLVSAAFSSDGSVLVIATTDGAIRLWGLQRTAGVLRLGGLRATIDGPSDVSSVSLDQQGRILAFSSTDTGAAVCLLVIGFDQPTCRRAGERGPVTALALDGSGSRLFIGWADGTVGVDRVVADGAAERLLEAGPASSLEG